MKYTVPLIAPYFTQMALIFNLKRNTNITCFVLQYFKIPYRVGKFKQRVHSQIVTIIVSEIYLIAGHLMQHCVLCSIT